MGYIHTGSQTATLSHFRGFGVVSVLYMDLHNNHRKFSTSPFIFLFLLLASPNTPNSHPQSFHRENLLWQTPPQSFHFDIPTFPCTFPPCAVIYLFSFLCIPVITCCSSSQQASGAARALAHITIICLYLPFTPLLLLLLLLLFLPAPNWSTLTVMALAASVIGGSIFFYESFCALLLFYYREGSWEGGGSSLFPGRTP